MHVHTQLERGCYQLNYKVIHITKFDNLMRNMLIVGAKENETDNLDDFLLTLSNTYLMTFLQFEKWSYLLFISPNHLSTSHPQNIPRTMLFIKWTLKYFSNGFHINSISCIIFHCVSVGITLTDKRTLEATFWRFLLLLLTRNYFTQ